MILAETNWPLLTICVLGFAASLITLGILEVRKAMKRDAEHRRENRKFDEWLRNDIDLHGGNE